MLPNAMPAVCTMRRTNEIEGKGLQVQTIFTDVHPETHIFINPSTDGKWYRQVLPCDMFCLLSVYLNLTT